MTSDVPSHLDDPAFDPLADLIRVLDLQRIEDTDPHDVVGDPHAELSLRRVKTGDMFLGHSQPMPHGRVFGGQVLAQIVIAAGRTLDGVDGPPRFIHSMHGYFLRAGDANAPLQFAVERLRDGRSFSARRVHALQDGLPIFSGILSFQTPSTGMDHQGTMPTVPPPESLPTDVDALLSVAGEARGIDRSWITRRPIEMRHCEGTIYDTPAERLQAYQTVWIRTVGELPADPLIHSAVLAYASDYTIVEAVLRRNGIAWSDKRLVAASLDHSMWFHRPAVADQWTLYSEYSPSSSGGRGLGAGRMFAQNGTLMATVAQEAMMRVRGT